MATLDPAPMQLRASILATALIGATAAAAPCSQPPDDPVDVELAARVTTSLGDQPVVVDIVRSLRNGPDCLLFRPRRADALPAYAFQLDDPGQFGLHVVELNRRYLVIDSATATGFHVAEVFVLDAGRPERLGEFASKTPPRWLRRGRRDLVETTDAADKLRRQVLDAKVR